MSKSHVWTPEQDAFLLEQHEKMLNKDIMEILGVTSYTMQKRWKQLTETQKRHKNEHPQKKVHQKSTIFEDKKLIQFLKNNANNMTMAELSQQTGHSVNTLYKVMSQNNITRNSLEHRQRTWTPEKDAFLLENKPNMTYKEIASTLNCSLQAVTSRYMKITGRHPKKSTRTAPTWRGRPWTEKEIQFITDHIDRDIDWIAKQILRSESVTRERRNKILRQQGKNPSFASRNNLYTDEEDIFLMKHIDQPRKWTAMQLGRSENAIRQHYRLLKKKKDINMITGTTELSP